MSDVSRIEQIFLNAASLSNPADREAYLDSHCGSDADLRRRVEALLAAQPQAQGFLEPVTVDRTSEYQPKPESQGVGTVIANRYTLTEVIGEGGMGTVWRAKQTEPVKRFVALKLIKPGMDSKQVLARFEAERQALAMMEHPNIAKILDGGVHDNRPFFVMELVKGTPITEFCDARRLTPRQRLELFLPVCLAIQHAHQKGIIHRDIKPSNVLIALYDDKPVPKVIDFGVAKATGGALTQHTIDTGFSGVVGTPQYMSPEQATFNNLDIDTRSDVYSLGTLLYELLAGSPPFARPELEKRGLLEILRVVREEEPPRPSLKLSTAEARASISANRSSEPAKLSDLMRGEIDWIVMKALEKDRSRRYDTANDFAFDVQRYLSGEPVQAVPPSFGYRLKKAYRKNRSAVQVIAAFAILLTGASIASGWLTVQAQRAEAKAAKNADAFYGAMIKADQALQKLEMGKNNQRVDADIHEVKVHISTRTGLLRLAQTLRVLQSIGPDRHYPLDSGGEIVFPTTDEFRKENLELKEFVTAAILMAGQEYSPLLPPISSGESAINELQLSNDGKSAITLGSDGIARLWDVKSAKQIAVLRTSNEKTVACGFSPDGRTAFTDDESTVVRLFDVPSGRFRAKTEQTNELFENQDPSYYTKYVEINDHRLITQNRYYDNEKLKGAVELWQTENGKRIARLDLPSRIRGPFHLLGSRWISAIHADSTVVLFSSADGREVGRIADPDNAKVTEILCSPNGNWVVVKYEDFKFRIWDTTSWLAGPKTRVGLIWIPLRVLDSGTILLWDYRDGQTCTSFRPGSSELADVLQGSWSSLPEQGDIALIYDGRLIDTRDCWVIQLSEANDRSILSKFASDGRFIVDLSLDAVTRKSLPLSRYWVRQLMISEDRNWWSPLAASNITGLGQVATSLKHRAETRLLPPPNRLNIPANQLELWLQVALRGEIGPDDRFLKWEESKWEKNRQVLAAIEPPYADIPFPGYLATDKLHWLRAEYETEGAQQQQIELELLRRTEFSGDLIEAARWRTVIQSRDGIKGPTPRVKK